MVGEQTNFDTNKKEERSDIDNNPQIKPSIHTLEGDLMNAVKDQNYSSNIVKIAANARTIATQEETSSNTTERAFSSKKIFFILGGLFFIIILLLVVFSFLKAPTQTPVENSNQSPASSTQVITRKSLLQAEAVLQLDLSNATKEEGIEKIKNIQNQLRDRNINEKTVVEIDTKLDIQNLFLKNRFSGDESLLNSFGGDYTFGIYNNTADMFETFLLIKINSFDTAFSSMLVWEPNIRYDLQDIFTDYTASSTESSVYNLSQNSKFSDKLIQNIDTRVDTDESNSIRFVYGFINKEYLVITTGVESFANIKDRLLNKNTLR